MGGVSTWVDMHSAYIYAETYSNDDNDLFVEEREPMDEPPEGSYREHMVKADDNLSNLAGYYYHGLAKRPARFWWAIMEANGIIDPTQPLQKATKIKIPDFRYVMDWLGYKHEVFT